MKVIINNRINKLLFLYYDIFKFTSGHNIDRKPREIPKTDVIRQQCCQVYEFALTSSDDDASVDDTQEQDSNQIGTDAFNIKVDNCASRSMSFNVSDFVSGSLVPLSDKGVRGFGNTVTPITHMGTISWSIYDDDGRSHDI